MSVKLPVSLAGGPETTWRRSSPRCPHSQVNNLTYPSSQDPLRTVLSLSGSDVEAEDDEDDGLARHVWDKYTNSKTDLTKTRERRENISALRKPVSLLEMTSEVNNLATAPKVTEEYKPGDKKTPSGNVVESESEKSKVLQLRKKPSVDLTGTASKDSESAGSTLTRLFGSKVKFTFTINGW